MNIVDTYVQRVCDIYVASHPNVDPGRVKQILYQFIEQKIRDIPCRLHNNVTGELIETSIINTFEWIEQRKPIISGNGTFFKQHSEEISPTVKMLEKLDKRRGVTKKKMYTYPKGSVEYKNLYVGQINVKVIMNADYGGSGTTMSPFYSAYIPPATTQSAKNITTTLICCLEFSTDSGLWSNMNSINELYDMIHIVLTTPEEDRDLIVDSFTPDEVGNRLISKTNNVTMDDVKVLKQYLSTLTQSDLSKLMLAFNIKYVLTNYVQNEVNVVAQYAKAHKFDISDITEESLNLVGFGVKAPDEIASYLDHICKTVIDNCVYPFMLNCNEVRADNMIRHIVCVTDTDSLMVHFASYIDAFQTRTLNHKESCILASVLGLRLFVESVIPKFVEYVAINCKVEDKYYRDKLIFKNEYGFLAMTLLAKKMYTASMFVQEGKPRDVHDVSVTGLSFKKRDSAEFLEPIMTRLYDKYILTSDNVDVGALLDEYYALRDNLMRNVDHDTSLHKVLSVKDINDYDPNKVLPAQMRGTIVWNNLMPDEEIAPMDRAIVIPLSFDLLEKNVNLPYVSEILRMSLINNEKKKNNPVICLPEHYKHIPDWIGACIDKEYAIDKLLSPFKQLFGLFDLVTPDTRAGMIPSRMMYI